MFRVNNKDIKTMSMTSLWFILNYSVAFVVDFEQVNNK